MVACKRLLLLPFYPFYSFFVVWLGCANVIEAHSQNMDDLGYPYGLADDESDFKCFVLSGGYAGRSFGTIAWQGFFGAQIKK